MGIFVHILSSSTGMLKELSEENFYNMKYDMTSPSDHFVALIATFIVSLIMFIPVAYAYSGYLKYKSSSDTSILAILFWVDAILILVNVLVLLIVRTQKRSYKYQKTLASMSFIYMFKLSVDTYFAYFGILYQEHFYNGKDIFVLMLFGVIALTLGVLYILYVFIKTITAVKEGKLRAENENGTRDLDFENTKVILYLHFIVIPLLCLTGFLLQSLSKDLMLVVIILGVASIIQYACYGKMGLIFLRSYCIVRFESFKDTYYNL